MSMRFEPALPRGNQTAVDAARPRLPDGSAQASGTLVHEGHGLGTWHIAGFHLRNTETGILDERRDRTVQVASASDSLPDWL